MLISIGLFVLQAVVDFLVFLFLLRFYLVLIKLNISTLMPDLARFLYAVTDGVVLRLRKILPKTGRFDVSSFIPIICLQLFYLIFRNMAVSGHVHTELVWFEILLNLILLIINALIGTLLLLFIMSWIQPNSPSYYFLTKLTEPLLNPIRRFKPFVGGIDLSPMVLLLLLQVVQKLIHSWMVF